MSSTQITATKAARQVTIDSSSSTNANPISAPTQTKTPRTGQATPGNRLHQLVAAQIHRDAKQQRYDKRQRFRAQALEERRIKLTRWLQDHAREPKSGEFRHMLNLLGKLEEELKSEQPGCRNRRLPAQVIVHHSSSFLPPPVVPAGVVPFDPTSWKPPRRIRIDDTREGETPQQTAWIDRYIDREEDPFAEYVVFCRYRTVHGRWPGYRPPQRPSFEGLGYGKIMWLKSQADPEVFAEFKQRRARKRREKRFFKNAVQLRAAGALRHLPPEKTTDAALLDLVRKLIKLDPIGANDPVSLTRLGAEVVYLDDAAEARSA